MSPTDPAGRVFVAGVILGALLWGASPVITGEREPWDSSTPYYSIGLLVCGFVAACFGPKRFWIAPCGIYVGQFAYAFLVLPGGPLWVLGLIFGAVHCVVALIGATLPFLIYLMCRRRSKAESM
jgi:hypothetical protein